VVMQIEGIHGLGAVGKTEREEADRDQLALRTVDSAAVGWLLSPDEPSYRLCTKFGHQDNYDNEILLGEDCPSATDNPPLVGAAGLQDEESHNCDQVPRSTRPSTGSSQPGVPQRLFNRISQSDQEFFALVCC
jgi:hypothetical protein